MKNNNVQFAIISVNNLIRSLRDKLSLARKNANFCYDLGNKYNNKFFMGSWSEYLHECKTIIKKIKSFEAHLAKLTNKGV